MALTAHGWNVFDDTTPVLTYTYSFGPGEANALAVGTKQGMIVISPPLKITAGVFDEVAQFGPVRALVASNAFHYMGIPEWKARFPEATIYAPAQSIARVERQTGLRDIRPLADAAPLTGPGVELVDMPHYRTGEALVKIASERGPAWYVTDCILNMPVLPTHPVARLVFGLSRSAPGLCFNNVAPLFMVKDKPALKRWLAAEHDRAPPRWLIPAHGDVLELAPDASPMRRLLG